MKWPVIEKNTINLSVYDKDNKTQNRHLLQTQNIFIAAPQEKEKGVVEEEWENATNKEKGKKEGKEKEKRKLW